MKISAFLSLALFSNFAQTQAKAIDTSDKNTALDEDFLLFLANATNNQGESIDQLDMLDINIEDLDGSANKVKQENESMTNSKLNDTSSTLAKERVE